MTSITLVLSVEVSQMLDDLVATGLYGKGKAEACERLICQALEEKLEMVLASRRRQS